MMVATTRPVDGMVVARGVVWRGVACGCVALQGEPFDKLYTSTIGVDFEIKPIAITEGKDSKEKHINLQIVSTAQRATA